MRKKEGLKLNKLAVFSTILLLGLWNHRRFKILTPSQPVSSSSKESLSKRNRPKVVILNRLDIKTGGPEALHQLLIAAHQVYPENTFMGPRFVREPKPKGVRPDRYFFKEYPGSIHEIPHLRNLDNLTRGDILIIPEVEPCPLDFVQDRGVRVFTYMLSTKHKPNDACPQLAHNHYFLNHPPFVSEHLLRPYLTPSWIPRDWNTAPQNNKERLLILNHDMNERLETRLIVKHLRHQCATTPEWNCTVQLVQGFDKAGLLDLFARAMLVVEVCLVGSERLILESSLYGVLPILTDCLCGNETRDFPIPRRNLVSGQHEAVFDDVIPRVLNNYETEHGGYADMRRLYAETVNAASLEEEMRMFLHKVIGL